jgi:protein phosphatase
MPRANAAAPIAEPWSEPVFTRGRPHLFAFGHSHAGLIRADNEDSFLVSPGHGLFAVADGVGGAVAGEVASRLAIDALRDVFAERDLAPDGRRSAAPGLPLLTEAVGRANALVHLASHTDPSTAGMATTLTALLIGAGVAAIAHVGDSRAYRLRGRRLELLTRDHTLIEDQVSLGTISRERARLSPLRNVLTRAIGTDPRVTTDLRLAEIQHGDLFLLASDGLHGVVGDDDIAAILRTAPDLTRAAAELVAAALDAGGPDNVTCVLVLVDCPRGGASA